MLSPETHTFLIMQKMNPYTDDLYLEFSANTNLSISPVVCDFVLVNTKKYCMDGWFFMACVVSH